jgi:hypothetical protein
MASRVVRNFSCHAMTRRVQQDFYFVQGNYFFRGRKYFFVGRFEKILQEFFQNAQGKTKYSLKIIQNVSFFV